MTAATLTSRQRVTRALEHRDQDRVARDDVLWPETAKRFSEEGLKGSAADVFGFDITRIGHLAPVPFRGRHDVIAETDETVDFVNEYGATFRRWKDRSGVPTHLGYECTDRASWESRFKPRFADPSFEVERHVDRYKAGVQADRWTCIGSRGPLCFIQTLVGDETLFMALGDNIEWVIDMAQTVTSAMLSQYQQLLDAGAAVDGLWVFDDVAYRNGLFMSPAMYEQTFGAQHKRMAAFAHERGLKFIFHTDGDVRTLIETFIDYRIDALQPLEAKAGLDVRKLAPVVGDRMALFGNIDMTVALTNDREKVEAEVVSKLRAGMATKGYLYHSDHSVPPQVSLATYRYIHELLDEHGVYA